MARIKKFAGDVPSNLSAISVFLVDENPNSDYFRISEFKEEFTGGKNGFLIEGSEFLKETTEVKIEILDVEGNTVYYEPGDGTPEYYEGISKVISVLIYEDTPIGIAKITILGELKRYVDDGGVVREVPEEWKGLYNVKWERTFKINKNLTNEDKVRFYRRPEVSITEIARPIFTANPESITQTGNVLGTPLTPSPGTDITTFPRPSQYLLTTLDDTRWTGSVVNSTITVDGQTLTPLEVVSETELVVSTPYVEDNIVTSFGNKSYSTTFNYIRNEEGLGTALSGSFGKFVITNLETFVGDVHRIKVFRTSQADLTDFQFVQEIVLESTEILIDYEQSQRDEESYGLFTPFILDEYWELSSVNITKEFNQSFLFNSVKLDSTGTNTFSTINNVPISNGIEYTLSFNTRIPEVVSGNEIEVYLQGTKDGTRVTQTIGTVEATSDLLQKSSQEFNFIARDFDDAKLYFKVTGENWYVATVSLRAAQETSFSPDEITFIQTVPRTLEQETFDFRFEFYDINNNYIPVLVTATKTFTAGNLNEIQKNIEIVATQLYFQFDSGSQQGNALPPKSIFFDINKEFLTGSTNFTSGAYDNDNNLLSASEYSATFYPGLLEEISTDRFRLTVENFSGSIYDNVVQYITYTAECEGVTDNITISRLADGKGGVNFDIRPFRGTVIRNSNPTSSVEIQAVRIDGINETNLRAGLPLDYSIPLLYITSESLEGDVSYITLEEASSSGYVRGLNAGSTGSGEINYNAEFNRDSIDGQRTVYLIPSTSPTSESILTSLTLTDLQDGLNRGVVKYDVDTFTINPYVSFANESLERVFTPTRSTVTGSFFRRGETEGAISGTLEVYPSMSINSDYNPQYWMYYVTDSFNSDVSIQAFDEFGREVLPTEGTFEGSPLTQSKQINLTFTYSEPFTTASVSVDQTFQIVPEGKPGDDSIVIELDPKSEILKGDESRFVDDYSPTVTQIKVKQGNREDVGYLTYQQEKQPGTFYINESDIISSSITFGGFATEEGVVTVVTNEAESMTDSPSNKTARIVYPIEIRPYFTSSYYTASISQSFTRVDDGAKARGLSLEADSQTVTYNGDGNIVEPAGDITLTATAFNTTGSGNINFYFYKDNNFIDLVNQNTTEVTKAVPSSEFPSAGTNQVYRVELHDGNADINATPNAVASLTISGVQDGTNNYQASVTNQNAVAVYKVDGTLDFSNTDTQIIAYKGNTQLTAVSSFSFPTFDGLGNIVPNGEYKVTITDVSSFLDLAGSLTNGSTVPVVSDVAEIGDLEDWTDPVDTTTLEPLNATGFIEFTVDFEDGRDSQVVRQNLSVSYEGNVGPGLIMRGEWTGSIDYIFDVAAKRRDAVFLNYDNAGENEVHYFATTVGLDVDGSEGGGRPYTFEPEYDGSQVSGEIDDNGWQYLGQQDFFVAAKLAIFEESFVKNTINVGNNPGNAFANIVLAGGRVDPYIAIGQSGTVGTSGDQTTTGVIGYDRKGIFLGMSTTGAGDVPRVSIKNQVGDRYLRWTGEELEIEANNFSVDANGNVSVEGTITVTGGNAATQDYADAAAEGAAASAGTSAQNYATDIANNIVNGAYGGGSFISGDVIFSPTIAGTAGIFTGFVSAGGFRLGQEVDPGASEDGLYINSNNFWFDNGNFSVGGASGVFTFDASGNGNINLNDTFTVDASGQAIATNGRFSGFVSASQGAIGGWEIDASELSSVDGFITLDATAGDESITVRDQLNIARFTANTQATMPAPGAGTSYSTTGEVVASQTNGGSGDDGDISVTAPASIFETNSFNVSVWQLNGGSPIAASGTYNLEITAAGTSSDGISVTAQGNYAFAQATVSVYLYNVTDGTQTWGPSQLGTANATSYAAGIVSDTAIPTSGVTKSGTVFLQSGKVYEFRFRYFLQANVSGYSFGDSLQTTVDFRSITADFEASLAATGMLVNGGGMQVVKSVDEYFRFDEGGTSHDVDSNSDGVGFLGNTTKTVYTDIKGGLGVDEIFTNAMELPNTSFSPGGGTDSGYVRLANNFVIQFGYIDGAGNRPNITFPITFDRIYSAGITSNRVGDTNDGYDYIDTMTTAGITRAVIANEEEAYWWAYGVIDQ